MTEAARKKEPVEHHTNRSTNDKRKAYQMLLPWTQPGAVGQYCRSARDPDGTATAGETPNPCSAGKNQHNAAHALRQWPSSNDKLLLDRDDQPCMAHGARCRGRCFIVAVSIVLQGVMGGFRCATMRLGSTACALSKSSRAGFFAVRASWMW